MEIGGQDLFFKYTSPPTAERILALCKRHWPNAIWQDIDSDLQSSEVCSDSREFFIYEDANAAKEWDNPKDTEVQDTIYFILESEWATVVIGTSDIPTTLQAILDDLGALGWEPRRDWKQG